MLGSNVLLDWHYLIIWLVRVTAEVPDDNILNNLYSAETLYSVGMSLSIQNRLKVQLLNWIWSNR